MLLLTVCANRSSFVYTPLRADVEEADVGMATVHHLLQGHDLGHLFELLQGD